MKTLLILSLSTLAVLARAQTSNAPPTCASILAICERVTDWQLAHPSTTQRYGERAWTYGAFYAGVMAADRLVLSSKYLEAMEAVGARLNWEPAPRIYFADDYCVSQMYLEVYLKDHDPAMLRPTKERFDFILAHPATNDLNMAGERSQSRWNWCDALFMGPPAWVLLFEATGDKRYLEFVDREWKATSDFLYDREEHLYFRDSTYFDKREANGKKIFWSRGNGWVMAGLARVIQRLPPNYSNRKFYEQQFTEMAGRIASLQQPDGLWRSSLLDPESYPLKETSGSSFYAGAIAWGVNCGLLKREKYEPVARKAWLALVDCVTPEGKLEHVQPVGADPKKFDPTHNDVFGAGAFLLAGEQMLSLYAVPGPAPAVHKR